MRFGEKLREQRERKNLTKGELAEAIGVTTRTLTNYENGSSHPQDREIYFKLAKLFEVDVNYLLTEDEAFLQTVSEKYGKRGRDRAAVLLEETSALFAGGELSDHDKRAFAMEMQAIFLDSKDRARKKFTPKKYRKPPESSDN